MGNPRRRVDDLGRREGEGEDNVDIGVDARQGIGHLFGSPDGHDRRSDQRPARVGAEMRGQEAEERGEAVAVEPANQGSDEEASPDQGPLLGVQGEPHPILPSPGGNARLRFRGVWGGGMQVSGFPNP